MPGEMLNVREVAEWFHVCRTTVRRWAKAKLIPAFRMGRNWHFERDLVTQLMKQRSLSKRMREILDNHE